MTFGGDRELQVVKLILVGTRIRNPTALMLKITLRSCYQALEASLVAAPSML